MLYIRMFLTMIVGLYTSRVVLNVLGVEDYGIYGVVGGVVAMLGFLNASMSGATSRFLTFELGRGNQKRLADTFSSALIVHLGIAFIVLIVAETVGLWFLNHKLVIPESRMPAAHWVYQCSIISAMLNITQVPYNAAIIAHEKMDVYAYVEILNVTLKLFIVYLLTIGNFDKLILYAILVLAVSALIMMVYRIYCLRHFQESHFHFIWDKAILKPLLSFSGWDVFGNVSVAANQYGTNFLINIYHGVKYNAASGVASMILGAVLGFTNQIIMAFRPQIIKLYAAGEHKQSMEMIYQASRLSSLLILVLILPVLFHMDLLLLLWLKTVPPKASKFCQLLLVAAFFNTLRSSLVIGVHSTGNVKRFSLYSGLVFLSCPLIVYLAYINGTDVEFAYVVTIVLNVVLLFLTVFIVSCLVMEFSILDFLQRGIIRVFLVGIALSIILKFEELFVAYNSIIEVFLLVSDFILCAIIGAFCGLNHEERQHLFRIVKDMFLLLRK